MMSPNKQNLPNDRYDTFVEDIQIVGSNQMQIPMQRINTGAIPKISQQSALLEPKAQYLPINFNSVVDRINSGERVCVILRGLPGF